MYPPASHAIAPPDAELSVHPVMLVSNVPFVMVVLTDDLVSNTSSIHILMVEAVNSTRDVSSVANTNDRKRAAALLAVAPMYPRPGRSDIGPSTRGTQLTMVSAASAMRFWSVRARPSGETIPRLKPNNAGYSRTVSACQIASGIAPVATI